MSWPAHAQPTPTPAEPPTPAGVRTDVQIFLEHLLRSAAAYGWEACERGHSLEDVRINAVTLAFDELEASVALIFKAAYLAASLTSTATEGEPA